MSDPTMSGDPAVEAAHRSFHPKYNYSWEDKTSGVASAREALRPVRDWCDKWLNELSIRGLDEALDELAPLIFTAEELTDD
ncbi:hypothetical protein [Mycobacteroides abscessus]|uniref:hypothetical protein n=1 Tax=Mycobacteroides abscessus TaxID=36809 RepID=UPI000D6A7231|nr:hypothetical protein [Mycobacteroides abscessus]